MTENGKVSTHRPPKASRALLDVDQRIVVALAERDEASRKVSLLVYWQDRLRRINQDLDVLISIQQRLSGQVPIPLQLQPIQPDAPSLTVTTPTLTIPYQHAAPISPSITSVPRPSGVNVAGDVEGEGGFS